MEFTLKTSKKNQNSNQISVDASTLEEVVNLLDHVDCTCVWSSSDNQYIAVNEVPADLVDNLKTLIKINNGKF